MTTNPESAMITLDELLLIQAAVTKVTRERDELRVEIERLRAIGDQMRAQLDASTEAMSAAGEEIERLRAALSEMLESFTEPEDDNDILRRARAALARPMEC